MQAQAKFRQEIICACTKQGIEEEGKEEEVVREGIRKRTKWFGDQLDLGGRRKEQSQVTSEVLGWLLGGVVVPFTEI